MITLIIGENSFENDRALARIVVEFDGEAEKIDGETLELKQLPDLLMGMSLFATKRLVVIRNMSANKSLWNSFEAWIGRVSDDIHLILVDAKPDKRTKTYKALQKSSTILESKLWTDRDLSSAQQWVIEEAKKLELELDKKSAYTLVAWVGVDQWALWQALQKLAVVGAVSPEAIQNIIEPNETENAFQLFEAALKGDVRKVQRMLQVFEKTEDPYRLFGLLAGQAFQLATLSIADVPDATIASDFSVHPFVLSKLRPFSRRLGRDGAKTIVAAFAEADTAMKTLAVEPWLLLERALLKAAKTA